MKPIQQSHFPKHLNLHWYVSLLPISHLYNTAQYLIYTYWDVVLLILSEPARSTNVSLPASDYDYA
jgi:hypothetical protein